MKIFHFIEQDSNEVVEVHAPNALKAMDILARHFLYVANWFSEVWVSANGVTAFLDEEMDDALIIQQISGDVYRFKTVSCADPFHHTYNAEPVMRHGTMSDKMAISLTVWTIKY